MTRLVYTGVVALMLGAFAAGLVVGCVEKRGSEEQALKPEKPEPAELLRIRGREVEAGCGACQLGMESDGCELAIRVDGDAYWVDGTGIDDHGDAHADDGFCNATRRARVTGEIRNGRVQVSEFEVL